MRLCGKKEKERFEPHRNIEHIVKNSLEAYVPYVPMW